MKRILVVRTDRVGDVVMITPLIRELRRTYPDAYIAALTRPVTKSILENNPHLNACITDDLDKEKFWDVVKEIRRHKFTHALLTMPTERAAYQLFLAGIPVRVGVGHKLYEVITFMRSVSRTNYIPLRHEADYCMDLGRKIGVETENIKPEIFVTDREVGEAFQMLSRRGVEKDDIKIVVHTGSFGSAPNWTEAKFLELIKRINDCFQNHNLKILLTAREMSSRFLTSVKQLSSSKIVNISNEVDDLRNFIKILSVCSVYISASTGPLHLASALNKKCIGLHCRRPMNRAQRWGVLNERGVNLEVSEEYCDKNCSADKNECCFEGGISVEQVINSIKYLLNGK